MISLKWPLVQLLVSSQSFTNHNYSSFRLHNNILELGHEREACERVSGGVQEDHADVSPLVCSESRTSAMHMVPTNQVANPMEII